MTKKDMRILAHDEHALTNLLFSEVINHNKVERFLDAVKWRSHSRLPFDIVDLVVHQQLNFSEFGKPDTVIIVNEKNGHIHVVNLDAKLKTYVESCVNPTGHKLNNQLGLRYRAMRAIPTIADVGFITEIEHVPESPYSGDQVRRCKKAATCNLFRQIAKPPFQFYLVALTSDRSSPFEVVDESHECYPLFFDQNTSNVEKFPNLGWVSWHHCNEIFSGIDNYFSQSFQQFSDLLSDNDVAAPAPEEMFVRGRRIIDYEGECCLLSCRGMSYSVRLFQKGKFVELDRGKKIGKNTKNFEPRFECWGKLLRLTWAIYRIGKITSARSTGLY